MYLATKRHFMLVTGAIGLRDTTEVPNNLCHGKKVIHFMAFSEGKEIL